MDQPNSRELDSTTPSDPASQSGVDERNDDNETSSQENRQRTPSNGRPRSNIREIMAHYHRISRDIDEYMERQHSQEPSLEGHQELREMPPSTPAALAESTRMAIERAEMLAQSGPPEQTSDQSRANGDDEVNNECSICFEVVPQAGALASEPGRERHYLPCAHFFHHGCITEWLQNFGAVCPLCRRDPRQAERELLRSSSPSAGSNSNSSTESGNSGDEERIGPSPLLTALLLVARYPGLFSLFEDALSALILEDLIRNDNSSIRTPRASVHEDNLASISSAETVQVVNTTETHEDDQRPTCTICQLSMHPSNQEESGTPDDSNISQTSRQSEDIVSTLPCAHSFHFACISTWLVESYSSWGRHRCPICRYELTAQEADSILNSHIPSPQSTSTVLPNNETTFAGLETPSAHSPASRLPSSDYFDTVYTNPGPYSNLNLNYSFDLLNGPFVPLVRLESDDENGSIDDGHNTEMDHSSNMLQDRNDASNSSNATPLVDLYSTASTRYPPLPLLSTRIDRDQRPESNTPPSPILYPMDIEDISFPEAQSPLQRRGQVDNPLRNATHSDPPTGIVTGDRNIPNSNTTITPLDLLRALPPVPTEEPGRNNDQTTTGHGQPGRANLRPSISHRTVITAREPEDGVRVPSPNPSISIPVRPPPVYSSQTLISPASTAQGVSHFHAQQPPLPEEQHHVITTQPRLTEQPYMLTPRSTTEPITQQPSYKIPMSMRSRKSYSQDTCDECSKTCNGTCKVVVACAPWLLGIGAAYGVYAFMRHVIQPACQSCCCCGSKQTCCCKPGHECCC